MPIKNVTLYSIPYIVGVASLIVAAHYVSPSLDETLLRPLSEKSAKSESFSGQVINRSRKGDRSPIRRATPQITKKELITVPTPIPPSPEIVNACEHGRCFADAGLTHDPT
jgi:hypothetical protein